MKISLEERAEEEEEREEEELERMALLSGRRRTLSLPFNYGAIKALPKPAAAAGPSHHGLPRSSSWPNLTEQQPLIGNNEGR